MARVLGVDGVEVWRADLPEHLADEDVELLGTEERRRMERYLRPIDAARFVGSRASARRVIASYLSVTPDEVVIAHEVCPACGSSEHGPPHISSPHTSATFSLSRSGPFALVAVAESGAVGVDVEVEARDFPYDDVAGRFLSEHERAQLATWPEAERRRAFYRCWVRKEAVVKAVGVGIVADLAGVEVAPEKSGPVAVDMPEGALWHPHIEGHGEWCERWTVHDVPLPQGVAGALALPAARQ